MYKLAQIWSNLRASFWFMPSLIVGGSIVAAVALIEVDMRVGQEWAQRWPRIFGAGAEGARGVLSTIAGTMMSAAGITFSMVLVALALAASQYSSRILRNFMRSRITQGVLGTFAGIFTYCLIVLRAIRGEAEGGFVPSSAVFFSVILAIAGIGVLIFFIHHIASSIQASNIVASIADETVEVIARLYPDPLKPGQPDSEDGDTIDLLSDRTWQTVRATRSGYMQFVNIDALLRIAREKNGVVRMECGTGDFVVRDTKLLSLSSEHAMDAKTIAILQSAFAIDRYRTVEQDPAFGIRKLVDVALKALSPGINDTTTAVLCVDHLTAVLGALATRRIPSPLRYEDGELRLIAKEPTFSYLLAAAFDQILSNSTGNAAMMNGMLDSVQRLEEVTVHPGRRRALREQLQSIAEVAARTVESTNEYAKINARLGVVRAALTKSVGGK